MEKIGSVRQSGAEGTTPMRTGAFLRLMSFLG